MSFFLFRIFTTTDFLFFTHVYIQMIVKGLQLTEACDSKCRSPTARLLSMNGNYKTCDNHLSSPTQQTWIISKHDHARAFEVAFFSLWMHCGTIACRVFTSAPDGRSFAVISPTERTSLRYWMYSLAFISACSSTVTFSHMYDCGMTVDCDINVRADMKEQEQQEHRSGSDVCGRSSGSEHAGLSGLMRRTEERACKMRWDGNKQDKQQTQTGQSPLMHWNNTMQLHKQQCIKV